MESSVLGNLEPKKVFYFFEEISKIPHGSGNTKKISDYLKNFAKERDLDFYQDDLNNVVIYKYLDNDECLDDIVILQGHMDMVCDKSPESSKDMELDGLDLVVDGDYVSARDTSLGADDGIAIAMILAILDDDSLDVPSIEAVFTSDEEIGLIGAKGLDFSKLNGRLLINLDSENEGVMVVSCAGGNSLDIDIPVVYDLFSVSDFINDGCELIEISVEGLRGGHSGLEINNGLANANKVLGELLGLLDLKSDFKLIDIGGGNLDNAIAKSANASILANLDGIKESVRDFELEINERFRGSEEGISLNIESVDLDGSFSNRCLSDGSKDKIIEFINRVPNGVYGMSDDFEGLVETSLNLGIISLDDACFRVAISVRSSKEDEKMGLGGRVVSLVEELGGSVVIRGDYPSWEYRDDSKLREIVSREYEELYGESMEVEIIHAGLECGIFSDKIEDLDAVSIGPNLEDVHSFNEKMSISSVLRTYDLLLGVLKELS